MDEMILQKLPNGTLAPSTPEDAEKLKKYKVGHGVRVKVTQMRPNNYEFHKKVFALFTYCYDVFADRLDTGLEFRGLLVKPSFDRFRNDLTIMAGHYEATFDINGRIRVEAKSLSYSNCTDEQKEKIFSDLIQAAINKVFKLKMSEDELRNTINNILAYD